uniref:Uncharacterized protein n=1 Tax=Dromaius novaehollandiae TaxID=8790 RepID=A0A8C4KGR5_DRONO
MGDDTSWWEDSLGASLCCSCQGRSKPGEAAAWCSREAEAQEERRGAGVPVGSADSLRSMLGVPVCAIGGLWRLGAQLGQVRAQEKPPGDMRVHSGRVS